MPTREDAPVEARIDAFLGKYTPELETSLRAARSRLRALFPRGHELVYDNYNALVFAISATGATPDAFVSVAGYPRWVTLFFLHGATLDDPRGLLEGTGKQVRGLRVHGAGTFDEPAVQALVAQAAAPWAPAFAAAPPLATTVKSVAQKQRPRRP